VVRELGLVRAVAMRLTRDHDDAGEVVQETLLRAYRAIDGFDGRYPRAWLLTILRNTTINPARKRTPVLLHDLEAVQGTLAAGGADGRDGPAAVGAAAPR